MYEKINEENKAKGGDVKDTSGNKPNMQTEAKETVHSVVLQLITMFPTGVKVNHPDTAIHIYWN